MRAVGIKVLRNRLSEYVRLAASGASVLVTDRGRVVAQLGPPPPQRAESVADAVLAQAVRERLITPAVVPPAAPPPVPPPGVMTLEEVLADLERSREDR
jgi:antitoxin (DNA-binding transcriptional repressor) of toxin-antitoxin stability system